jgi:hypothetical protein
MSRFAAADPGPNSDAAVEQVGEVDAPTLTRGLEDEEAPVTVAEVPSAAEKQRAENTEAAPGLWDRYSQELLGLLALLVLWLVTRLLSLPNIEVKRRTKRHSPLTPDEFTRILFRIVVGEDVEAYRTMYLTGTEACKVMGNSAGADYLKNRSPEVFELAFDALFDRLPAGSRYVKGHLSPSDVVELWVLDSRGMRHCIPVGHVAYIGAIMRLVTPVVGTAASPRVEYVGEPDVLAPTA